VFPTIRSRDFFEQFSASLILAIPGQRRRFFRQN